MSEPLTSGGGSDGAGAADVVLEKREKDGWGGVRRLQVHRRKMQEMVVDCDRALLVFVHAHISLAESLASVRTVSGDCAAVILPCCNWYSKLLHPDGRTPPGAEYEDPAVVSPQRLVRVFPSLPCGVSQRRAGGGGGGGGGVLCGQIDREGGRGGSGGGGGGGVGEEKDDVGVVSGLAS